MQTKIIFTLILTMLLGVNGCGQKGPLYLPAPTPNQPPSLPPAPMEANNYVPASS